MLRGSSDGTDCLRMQRLGLPNVAAGSGRSSPWATVASLHWL